MIWCLIVGPLIYIYIITKKIFATDKNDVICKFKVYSTNEIIEMLSKLDSELDKQSIEEPDVSGL